VERQPLKKLAPDQNELLKELLSLKLGTRLQLSLECAVHEDSGAIP
jgi:hypothetical protein